jgi:excisionase family DNA binding protein
MAKELDSEWLTTAEAARMLGVHVSTLRRWSDLGLVPTLRMGQAGKRRYRRTDIVKLVRPG